VRFRFVDVAEVDRNVIAQNGITESVLQSQWRRKSRFFAGIADDGSLCYFSIVDQEGFTIGQRYQIAFRSDREAYVWSCYTAPAYRGRGIYGAALRSLGCELRAEGKSLLYLYVEMENDQSAKGVRKAGFVAAAEAWVYGFRSVIRRGWRLLPGPEGLPVQYIRDWDVTPVTHTGEDLPM
jgi:L-amino acid N-acyltransferase YncA